jgi:hypothetical protein
MKSRLGLALAVSTIVASATLLGANAYAQQQTQTPAPQKSSPAATPTGSQNATPPSAEMQPNVRAQGAMRGRMLAMLGRMSPQDRAAILDAHLAAIKAGLELTADQDKLWTPLEQAVRDGVNKAVELRQKYAGQQQAADPMQRLTRLSEMASARADFLHRFVDSAQPLYASLTPDQKNRLPMLMHMMGGPAGNSMQANKRREMMGEGMRERMRQRMEERHGGGGDGQRMGEGMRGNMGGGGERDGWREGRGQHRDWRQGGQQDGRRGDAGPQRDNNSGDGQE